MRIIENMILCKWPSVKWHPSRFVFLLSGPDSVANVTGWNRRDAQAPEVNTDVAA
jgi:hypothetical protein